MPGGEEPREELFSCNVILHSFYGGRPMSAELLSPSKVPGNTLLIPHHRIPRLSRLPPRRSKIPQFYYTDQFHCKGQTARLTEQDRRLPRLTEQDRHFAFNETGDSFVPYSALISSPGHPSEISFNACCNHPRRCCYGSSSGSCAWISLSVGEKSIPARLPNL